MVLIFTGLLFCEIFLSGKPGIAGCNAVAVRVVVDLTFTAGGVDVHAHGSSLSKCFICVLNFHGLSQP